MNILIAGASGFIGQELTKTLMAEHQLTLIGRKKKHLERQFSSCPVQTYAWSELAGLDAKNYDVIINLSGQSIAASRWTAKVKKQLIASRVNTSHKLIAWAIKNGAKPHFYCANAIGIYGLQTNGDPQAFDEDSPIDFDHPHDFLSEIAIHWQNALKSALDFGMPVTTTRFGVVLKKDQGMLKKLVPSFYLGLGSIIGDGKQALSWVHIDDVIGAYLFLLARPELTGAINITSPNPVTQADFARSLAKAMRRPLLWKTPAFVIRRLLGQMGEELIIRGQKVVPKRLLEEGYQFHYSELEPALAVEFQSLPQDPK